MIESETLAASVAVPECNKAPAYCTSARQLRPVTHLKDQRVTVFREIHMCVGPGLAAEHVLCDDDATTAALLAAERASHSMQHAASSTG